MKRMIEISEEDYKVIERLKFLVGGRTDRKLQQTVINAIKNSTPLNECKAEDCISRQAVLNRTTIVELDDGQSFTMIEPEEIRTLPSVYPKSDKSVLEDIKQIVDSYYEEDYPTMTGAYIGKIKEIVDSHISGKEQE